MKKVIFIPTASVIGNQPSEWLKERLDKTIEYCKRNKEECQGIVVSGRWCNVTDSYTFTEAEVAKRYLLKELPDCPILKEELAVETGGNFAFSKPLIASFSPKIVVIFNSQVNGQRTKYFAQKIFGLKWQYEFHLLDDIFSQNPRAQRKEPKALEMFQKLFQSIKDGDDSGARQVLLYQTPFYYKGIIDDQTFFDQYWPGGFNDFLEKRLSIDNK